MLVLTGCAKKDDAPLVELASDGVNTKDAGAIEKYIQSHNIFAEKDRSGLYYKVIKFGDSVHQIGLENVPTLIYTRRLLNDRWIDASFGPTDFGGRSLKDHILGWQIGLQKITKGGKILLIIPSNLAFGDAQTGDIPPNSPLVCELELVDFK